MSKQIFADGLSSIQVVAGTVRLEFFMFSSAEAGAQPTPIPLQTLVMATPSFLLFAQKVQEAAGKLAPVPPAGDPAARAPKSSKPRFP